MLWTPGDRPTYPATTALHRHDSLAPQPPPAAVIAGYLSTGGVE